MNSPLVPGVVFAVVGMTVRTCPRKTKGALSESSRTSAMAGGDISRHQEAALNNKIARPTMRVASQTLRVFNLDITADSCYPSLVYSGLLAKGFRSKRRS